MGSSPRVRGTPFRIAYHQPRHGIIPACAGNTCLLVRPCADRGDHPRVCGEHAHVRQVTAAALGSSPRVRGTLSLSGCQVPCPGIIPACAGNTFTRNGVHEISQGSSPRVRGTRHHPRRTGRDPGIIPACAGNTSHRIAGVRSYRDHPRVCGEHGITLAVVRFGEGSSPRVRGTRVLDVLRALGLGIIPACAGNT